MAISVDAMGGDRGPAAVVAGIDESAQKNPDIRFIVHGPGPSFEALIARRPGLAGRCDIRDAAGRRHHGRQAQPGAAQGRRDLDVVHARIGAQRQGGGGRILRQYRRADGAVDAAAAQAARREPAGDRLPGPRAIRRASMSCSIAAPIFAPTRRT